MCTMRKPIVNHNGERVLVRNVQRVLNRYDAALLKHYGTTLLGGGCLPQKKGAGRR